jgi:hypothetical protein
VESWDNAAIEKFCARSLRAPFRLLNRTPQESSVNPSGEMCQRNFYICNKCGYNHECARGDGNGKTFAKSTVEPLIERERICWLLYLTLQCSTARNRSLVGFRDPLRHPSQQICSLKFCAKTKMSTIKGSLKVQESRHPTCFTR